MTPRPPAVPSPRLALLWLARLALWALLCWASRVVLLSTAPLWAVAVLFLWPLGAWGTAALRAWAERGAP